MYIWSYFRLSEHNNARSLTVCPSPSNKSKPVTKHTGSTLKSALCLCCILPLHWSTLRSPPYLHPPKNKNNGRLPSTGSLPTNHLCGSPACSSPTLLHGFCCCLLRRHLLLVPRQQFDLRGWSHGPPRTRVVRGNWVFNLGVVHWCRVSQVACTKFVPRCRSVHGQPLVVGWDHRYCQHLHTMGRFARQLQCVLPRDVGRIDAARQTIGRQLQKQQCTQYDSLGIARTVVRLRRLV